MHVFFIAIPLYLNCQLKCYKSDLCHTFVVVRKFHLVFHDVSLIHNGIHIPKAFVWCLYCTVSLWCKLWWCVNFDMCGIFHLYCELWYILMYIIVYVWFFSVRGKTVIKHWSTYCWVLVISFNVFDMRPVWYSPVVIRESSFRELNAPRISTVAWPTQLHWVTLLL